MLGWFSVLFIILGGCVLGVGEVLGFCFVGYEMFCWEGLGFGVVFSRRGLDFVVFLSGRCFRGYLVF